VGEMGSRETQEASRVQWGWQTLGSLRKLVEV
jgi:hypothetical protein